MTSNQKYAGIGGAVLLVLAMIIIGGDFDGRDGGGGGEESASSESSGSEESSSAEGGSEGGSEGGGEALEGEMFADADAGAGEKVFRKCSACHKFGENAVGPDLEGLIGREIASVEGYDYSDALKSKDGKWDPETLAGFLSDPASWAEGTKMSFAGLGDEAQIANVIAYIHTESGGAAPGGGGESGGDGDGEKMAAAEGEGSGEEQAAEGEGSGEEQAAEGEGSGEEEKAAEAEGSGEETSAEGEGSGEEKAAEGEGSGEEKAAEGEGSGEEKAAEGEGSGGGGMFASADPDAGKKVFRKCRACHKFGENAVGPDLKGVVGREIASVEGFGYSDALKGKDGSWDPETLAAFLADPKGWAEGTKMSFAGLGKEADRANVIAYMNAESDEPMELAAAGGSGEENAAEGEGSGEEKAAEGEGSGEEKAAEGEGSGEEKAAEGEGSGEEKAAEGEGSGEEKAAEGEGSGEEKAAEGEGSGEEKAAEGEGSDEPKTVKERESASLSVGQAALLTGGVNAFVSQVDAEGQRVRVALEGKRHWVEAGSPMKVEGTDCEVSLDGIEGRAATLSAKCGGGGSGSADSSDDSGSEISGTTTGVGETVALADGAIRAFISSVDAGGKRARVAVNGYASEWLESGKALEVPETGCTITLNGIDGRRAALSADCGGGEGGEGGSASGSGGGGESVTLRAGETALLANKTVRMFLSRVNGESGTARVSVNGQTRTDLSEGEATDVEGTGCALTLTGIDGRSATISADCGEDVSEAGEESGGTAKAASTSGPALGAGQTHSSGDLRVFVSQIDREGKRARVAINGQKRVWLEEGTSHDAGNGCSVTLDGIGDGGASISAACEGEASGDGEEKTDAGGDQQQASTGGGDSYRTGSTMSAKDGELRVFVSKVEEGRARLSINGEKVWIDAGQSHDAGNGCSVTLEGIEGRQVMLSNTCG